MRFNPPRASLIWTLALAYLGLALLAAVTVRFVSLSMELGDLDRDLKGGWLARAAGEAARGLSVDLPADPRLARARLTGQLRSVQAGLSDTEHGGVLSELANPIGMQVLDREGRVLAQVGQITGHSVPRGTPVTVQRLPDPAGAWRYAAPLTGRDGRPQGLLLVELTRHAPGLRALRGDGFEWPAVVVYAMVFGLGSALLLQWRVTRRLNLIADAADAWSEGDFTREVADTREDEIGRLSQRLDQMARQLEVLLAIKAELAGVNERQRLARDLHDTVKQKAFALQLQLAAAERAKNLPQNVGHALEDARRITHEIQEELAQLIGGTADVSSEPFDQILARRADAWGRRGNFAVEADLAAARDLPAPQRPILIRVLDEALANVMRHSGAAHAEIAVRASGGRMELEVEDDGRGLGQAAGEGMGLQNMKRRAAELPDGGLSVDKGGRGGVRVILSWTRSAAAGT
jgi:signal transduction histidine kinase